MRWRGHVHQPPTSKLYQSVSLLLQLGTYLLRKQAAAGVKQQREGPEEERERRKRKIISDSDPRPRHAEENNQIFSRPCHEKRESLAAMWRFSKVRNIQVRLRRQQTPDTGGQIHHSVHSTRLLPL